jgi:hypothetical protein
MNTLIQKIQLYVRLCLMDFIHSFFFFFFFFFFFSFSFFLNQIALH